MRHTQTSTPGTTWMRSEEQDKRTRWKKERQTKQASLEKINLENIDRREMTKCVFLLLDDRIIVGIYIAIRASSCPRAAYVSCTSYFVYYTNGRLRRVELLRRPTYHALITARVACMKIDCAQETYIRSQ